MFKIAGPALILDIQNSYITLSLKEISKLTKLFTVYSMQDRCLINTLLWEITLLKKFTEINYN